MLLRELIAELYPNKELRDYIIEDGLPDFLKPPHAAPGKDLSQDEDILRQPLNKAEPSLEIDIPLEIVDFIRVIRDKNTRITSEHFQKIFEKLNQLDRGLKSFLIYQIKKICAKRLDDNGIGALGNFIEDRLNGARSTADRINTVENAPVNTILNIHHFLIEINKIDYRRPGFTDMETELLPEDVLFAMNSLYLLRRLPELENNEPRPPYYPSRNNPYISKKPEHQTKLSESDEKADAKKADAKKADDKEEVSNVKLPKGVKESQKYFPFKRASKIEQGDTGNTVFMATDGKKFLYVRETPCATPDSILASKIATVISKKQFSSERLLSNGLVASKKLACYAHSLGDQKLRNDFYEAAKTGFIQGSGVVDEVCSFVSEGDPNIENIGASNKDPKIGVLCKIDFDRCRPCANIEKKKYDETHTLEPDSKITPAYIEERLTTRLHLSLLPAPLFEALTRKALGGRDDKDASSILDKKTKDLFDLFLEHKDAKSFLQEKPKIIDVLYYKIMTYAQRHFDAAVVLEIAKNLNQKIEVVIAKIDEKFKLKFEMPAFKVKEVVIEQPTSHQRMIAKLNNYINQRAAKSEYLSLFGRYITGMSRTLKVNAATKLRDALSGNKVLTFNQDEIEALREGSKGVGPITAECDALGILPQAFREAEALKVQKSVRSSLRGGFNA